MHLAYRWGREGKKGEATDTGPHCLGENRMSWGCGEQQHTCPLWQIQLQGALAGSCGNAGLVPPALSIFQKHVEIWTFLQETSICCSFQLPLKSWCLPKKLHLKAQYLILVIKNMHNYVLYHLAPNQKPTISHGHAPFPGFGLLPIPQPTHLWLTPLKMITSKWYLFPRPAKQPLPERCWLTLIPLHLVTQILSILPFIIRCVILQSLTQVHLKLNLVLLNLINA